MLEFLAENWLWIVGVGVSVPLIFSEQIKAAAAKQTASTTPNEKPLDALEAIAKSLSPLSEIAKIRAAVGVKPADIHDYVASQIKQILTDAEARLAAASVEVGK